MSNAADMLPADVRAAATAIANARAGRRGVPAVTNILDVLPQDLFAELVEDARAAIAAADAARKAAANTPKPRLRGPVRAADAEALRLDLNAGTLLILTRDRSSRAAAALSAAGADTALLEHDEAHAMWVAVAACLRAFPDEQEPTT
ncbi:hypothetical protein PUR23_26645 [Methylorubrum populi]|uniref:hypothetical protein n=1 Tax=Methylorubrum populi TaxID=223967 RepID=UPI0031F97A19